MPHATELWRDTQSIPGALSNHLPFLQGTRPEQDWMVDFSSKPFPVEQPSNGLTCLSFIQGPRNPILAGNGAQQEDLPLAVVFSYLVRAPSVLGLHFTPLQCFSYLPLFSCLLLPHFLATTLPQKLLSSELEVRACRGHERWRPPTAPVDPVQGSGSPRPCDSRFY